MKLEVPTLKPGSEPSAHMLEVRTLDSSGSTGELEEMLMEGTSTLGASAISQVRACSMALLMGALASSVTLPSNPAMAQALPPQQLAVAGAGVANEGNQRSGARIGGEVTRLVQRALAAIEQEPVEDGVSHPAEQQLKKILQKGGATALYAEVFEARLNTSLVASLVRLLGRLAMDNSTVEEQILREALASPHIEIRDAAVQAAELWANPIAFDILREHIEPVPWLAEYITRVLREVTA